MTKQDCQIMATLSMIFMALLFIILYRTIDTPVVYQSTASGKCVSVHYAEGKTCKNLPEKYTVIFVQ